MPLNGSGVASKPSGTTASPNTTIESAKFNSVIDDIYGIFNTDRPVSKGGTGAATAAAARTNLGVEAGLSLFGVSTNTTLSATQNNGHIRCTAALTLSLTAAATLGANWHCWVVADGGDVVIDPNGAETINGAATLTVPDGFSVQVVCNGTAFFANKDAQSVLPITGGTMIGDLRIKNAAGPTTRFERFLRSDGTLAAIQYADESVNFSYWETYKADGSTIANSFRLSNTTADDVKLNGKQIVTEANIMAQIGSNSAAGGVGSIQLLARDTLGTAIAYGTTYAGSTLLTATLYGDGSGVFASVTSAQSGTWRALGSFIGVSGKYPIGIFQRIV